MATSDLVTLIAEMGLPALVLAVLIGASLLTAATPTTHALESNGDLLRRAAMAATLTVAAFMSVVDNVLLVQPTAFVAAMAVGSLTAQSSRTFAIRGARWLYPLRLAAVMVIGAVCAGRLVVQTTVAWRYSTGASIERLEELAAVDPGEYWLNMALAFEWLDRRKCDLARYHARRAAGLFPTAMEPRIIDSVCPASGTTSAKNAATTGSFVRRTNDRR
jgi:hypothetical protein